MTTPNHRKCFFFIFVFIKKEVYIMYSIQIYEMKIVKVIFVTIKQNLQTEKDKVIK